MDSPDYVLSPLTLATAEANLVRLLELDRETPGEPWTAQHWLLSLPEKWSLSRIAVTPAGAIIGFQVASRKGDSVHVHRTVVAEGARRLGLGRRFMRDAAAQAASEGCDRITGKVHPSNEASLRFMLGLGFEVVERARNVTFAGQPTRIAAAEAPAAVQRAAPESVDRP